MMYLASYDWRLSYHNLEVRDRFFTKLKAQIELNKKIYGKKTVVMTHSMGGYMQSIDACVVMFGINESMLRLYALPLFLEMGREFKRRKRWKVVDR